MRKNVPTDLEIRNIHTNTAHPGVIYAELYRGNDLVCSATLNYCTERAKGIVNNEEVDVMELHKFMKILNRKHVCHFCGEYMESHFDEYNQYFECRCDDAVKDREIVAEIEKLKSTRPKPKYRIVQRNVLVEYGA